jgi:integrator complex subunit 3
MGPAHDPAPSLSLQFPDETLRSGELLNMIVAVIDSAQVNIEP